MTRALRAFVYILSFMALARGLDYVTGNEYDLGRLWGEDVAMPYLWGAACLAGGVAAVVAAVFRFPGLAVNAGIFNFATNVMLAAQVAEYRMLPYPWPPEDIRITVDHLGHAVLWLTIAVVVWWREGVLRRRSEIIEENMDGPG